MTRRLQCPEDNEQPIYYNCEMSEEPGNPVIACNGLDCAIEWFHFSCIEITNSNEEWYCDKCKMRLCSYMILSLTFNYCVLLRAILVFDYSELMAR